MNNDVEELIRQLHERNERAFKAAFVLIAIGLILSITFLVWLIR